MYRYAEARTPESCYVRVSIIVTKSEPHLLWGPWLCLAAMPLSSLRAAGCVAFAIPIAATRRCSVLGGRLVGFVILGLMLAQHNLPVAVDRKSLQHHIETLAVLVRKRHADIEPIVVLLLSLDDRVDPIHLRHVEYSLVTCSKPCERRLETHTRVALLQSALEHSDAGRERPVLRAL